MGETLLIYCDLYSRPYTIPNVVSFKLDSDWFVVTLGNGRSCFFNATSVIAIGFEEDFKTNVMNGGV